MGYRALVLGLAALFTLGSPLHAAPLFPDVPEDHWARDHVAVLAARGIVEGYPDGTFKGDRAATRWEVAMVVARLLARMEAEHATFVTRAELEEIRRLVAAHRDELDALGVRVPNLKDSAARLEARVSELERITFYGQIDTRVGAQAFWNTGSPAMGGTPPLLDYNSATGSATGAGGLIPPPSPAAGLAFNPFVVGALTVTRWDHGIPLTNGSTFTARALLGTRVRLTDSLNAGLELAAFTSQGDAVVDAWWGLTAPALSNPFTANGSPVGTLGIQPQDRTPYTRLSLDRFWLEYRGADNLRMKLVVGAFGESRYDARDGTHTPGTVFEPRTLGAAPLAVFDSIVYVPQYNPSFVPYLEEKSDRLHGPRFLPSFGVQLTGSAQPWGAGSMLSWELMGTRLADGNVSPVAPALGYFSHAEGGNLRWSFSPLPPEGSDAAQMKRHGTLDYALKDPSWRGGLQLNALHAANDAGNGSALAVGLIQIPNFTLNWVNPPEFFFNQLGGPNLATAGIGSTSDVRPVPGLAAVGNDGIVGIPGIPNLGGVGPQDQTTLGLSGEYTFGPRSGWLPRIQAEWARTDYRPQKNSTYSVSGNAFRVMASAIPFRDRRIEGIPGERRLRVQAEYLAVDPTFDPFLLQYPTVGGITTTVWKTPDFHYYNSMYSLHDTHVYPHNREGVKARINWTDLVDLVDLRNPDALPDPDATSFAQIEYGSLTQRRTSLQDVRFSPGSLGAGSPNTPVLGYSPGFLDPVFGPYAASTFTGPAGGNAFATPLEDPRGRVSHFSAIGSYKFRFEPASAQGVSVAPYFARYNFFRPSNLQALAPGPGGTRGESQNRVDLTFQGYGLTVRYDVTPKMQVRAGYAHVDIFGHLDPLGSYNDYAEATGTTTFENVSIGQDIPEIGFEWEVAPEMLWGVEARYYLMNDRLPASQTPSPTVPALNIAFPAQGNAHPFNWQGWQVMSSLSTRF